jgi:hypothetical protein
MLAFTTRHPGFASAMRCSVSATQPCAASRPYAADNESPNTITVGGGSGCTFAGNAVPARAQFAAPYSSSASSTWTFGH